MLENIVLLIDNLECAQRAAKFTAELARTYRSRVTVLNAYRPAPASSFSTYFLALGSDNASRKARTQVNQIVTYLNQLGIENVKAETRVGSPRKVFWEAADALEPDLIVVGSCGDLFPARRKLNPVELVGTQSELVPILIV